MTPQKPEPRDQKPGERFSFRVRYASVALPQLRETLGRQNPHALPRVTHVIVASGVGKRYREPKAVEDVVNGLRLITGQRPVPREARQSIAGFKVREGQVVGYVVTLRGRRMDDFLSRLLWVALPRVRDFRGIPPRSVDAQGNLTIGLREASAFPEVDPADVETAFGLQVTIVSTARNRDEGLALFRAVGVPFIEEEPPGRRAPRRAGRGA